MKKKHPIISRLSLFASLDLTIILLLLLSVLVVWGTLYQVEHGIYAAQEHFFKAWFTTIGGFFPFPAFKTLILLLALNLIAQVLYPRKLNFKTAGLYIIHIGVMILVAGSAVASRLVKESTFTLQKGQTAREAYDFTTWDVTLTEHKNGHSHKMVMPLKELKNGSEIALTLSPASCVIDTLYKNCTAMIDQHDRATIRALKPLPVDNKNGRNIPGLTFSIHKQENTSDVTSHHIFAGTEHPAITRIDNATLSASILPYRLALPLSVTLHNFDIKWHPGTQKAKSYQSTVRVLGKNIDRDVIIEMNRPFRYGAYTFYQMSYSGQEGHYATSIAVVYNPLRYMPYVASLVVVAGLLLHFLVKMGSTLSSVKGRHRE